MILSLRFISLLLRHFVFCMLEASGKCERLVMSRKGPWDWGTDGRRSARRLARCLLPVFLCAHIFIDRETSGYEAGVLLYVVLL